jgi:hypothetical protein
LDFVLRQNQHRAHMDLGQVAVVDALQQARMHAAHLVTDVLGALASVLLGPEDVAFALCAQGGGGVEWEAGVNAGHGH